MHERERERENVCVRSYVCMFPRNYVEVYVYGGGENVCFTVFVCLCVCM